MYSRLTHAGARTEVPMCAQHSSQSSHRSGFEGACREGGSALSPLTLLRAGTVSHVGLERKGGLFCSLLLLTACHTCGFAMRSTWMGGGP